jgi:hypothetical protein
LKRENTSGSQKTTSRQTPNVPETAGQCRGPWSAALADGALMHQIAKEPVRGGPVGLLQGRQTIGAAMGRTPTAWTPCKPGLRHEKQIDPKPVGGLGP